MDELRSRVADTLANGDTGASLRALRWVAAWSVPTLEQATRDRDAGELLAIEAVILLDDALTSLADLVRAVPPLLEAATPGPAIETYLQERVAELARVAEAVRTTRTILTELQASEQHLRDRNAELAALREQVDELRRLERLVTALEELREQGAVLEERLVLLRQSVGDVERVIAAKGAELVRLSDARRALLSAQTQEMLQQVAAAHQALSAEESRCAQVRAELEDLIRQHEQLTTERDERLAALAVHSKADRTVAEALAAVPGFDDERPAVEQVKSLADDVEQRLREVDAVLREVLEARSTRQEKDRAELRWSDAPSAG